MPAQTRFVVLTNFDNDAVLDRESGPVWWRTPDVRNISMPYPRAQKNCLASNVGGRGGWRLPTAPESMTLFDPNQPRPFLVAGHPFRGNLPSFVEFWTSTSDPASGRFHVIGYDPVGVRDALQVETQDVSATGMSTWCVGGPT